jgi:glycosyltransferase involved in cell wall biosynthesis
MAHALETPSRRVIVHIGGNSHPEAFYRVNINEQLRLRFIGRQQGVLEEPLVESGGSLHYISLERARLDILSLRNSVAREVTGLPNDRHIIISNYVTGIGFQCAAVAEDLGLSHIACVVGTDFSRGFFEPSERYVFESTVSRATCVVTFNGEQARHIRATSPHARVELIHPGLDEMVSPVTLKPTPCVVGLFSDCGYSYKKGTQILLQAFSALVQDGLPVELTVCGATFSKQETYWEKLRAAFTERFGTKVRFLDHLVSMEVDRHRSAADIYCSATLGEGCSGARVAALCAGLPIVSTECGEINDVARGTKHVYLAPPGDPEAYLSALRLACDHYLSGQLIVDQAAVKRWQKYFTFQRELSLWQDLLATL